MRSTRSSPRPSPSRVEDVDAAEGSSKTAGDGERPILVVSPERTEALPILQKLLQGDPEIEIVVDRRVLDRRADPDGDEGAPPETERRESERRRRGAALYLV